MKNPTFAWAIAQHESRAGNRVFNQFNPSASQSFFEQPNKTVNGNGWGITQIDGGTNVVATAIVWDWHVNVAQRFRSPWEFVPATGTWIFHQNVNNYASRIAQEMQQTGIQE